MCGHQENNNSPRNGVGAAVHSSGDVFKVLKLRLLQGKLRRRLRKSILSYSMKVRRSPGQWPWKLSEAWQTALVSDQKGAQTPWVQPYLQPSLLSDWASWHPTSALPCWLSAQNPWSCPCQELLLTLSSDSSLEPRRHLIWKSLLLQMAWPRRKPLPI